MSDGGLLPHCPFDPDVVLAMVSVPRPIAIGIGNQLADFLAYLEQRRDNAFAVATRWPDFETDARAQRRQLDLIIGDLIAGMHEGAAGVRARLQAAAAQEQETGE